jgi:hypothetical protein
VIVVREDVVLVNQVGNARLKDLHEHTPDAIRALSIRIS